MSEWKEYKLGELYDISSGLSKAADEFGFGHTFISFKDVFNNYFIPEFPEALVNSNEKDWKSCSVKKGDILLTRTSETIDEVGMSSVALKDYENSTFNGFCKRLRPKANSPIKVSPLYIGYLLRTRYFRKTVANYSTMTTRASLNGESIGKIPLNFPAYEIQEEIGKTLYSLEKKISLLRQQNQTLEELSQTLYKRWFVDFEFPNKNGKPYKSSGGKMIDSELGEIPEGWYIGRIYDVLNVQYGFPFKSSLFNEVKIGNPLIRIRDLKKGMTGFFTTESFKDEYVVRCGDIVAGMDAEFRPVVWSGEDGLLNQRVCRFLPKNEYSEIFILEFIKPHLDFFEKTKGATTVIHLGKGDLDSIEALIPEDKIIVHYSQNMSSIHKTQVVNHNEIRTLTNLRDSLLPKLMSGEMTIQNN